MQISLSILCPLLAALLCQHSGKLFFSDLFIFHPWSYRRFTIPPQFPIGGTSTIEKEHMKFQVLNGIKVGLRWKPGIAFKNTHSFGQLWYVLIELLAVRISMHFKTCKYIKIFCATRTGIHNSLWNTEQRGTNKGGINNLITKIDAKWLEDKNLRGDKGINSSYFNMILIKSVDRVS